MPKRKRSMDKNVSNPITDITEQNTLDAKTAKVAAGGAGGVAGATAGAAIGSVAPPVGTVIGAIAGAVGGWWAGKSVVERVSDFGSDEEFYRSRFESSSPRPGFTYERARPAYQLGYLAAGNPDYSGRPFDEIEPDLSGGWNEDLRTEYGEWEDVRDFAADSYAGADERIATRREQELAGDLSNAAVGGEVEIPRKVAKDREGEPVDIGGRQLEMRGTTPEDEEERPPGR